MNGNAIDWQGFEHWALTDVGIRRTSNEDSLSVLLAEDEESWRRRGHLFLVADGMGAHAAGKLASQTAVDSVCQIYRSLDELPAPAALKEAIRRANRHLHAQSKASEDLHGMGTTLTGLLLLPEGAYIAHVGDSRVYRSRANRLEQLTFDHSLAWEVAASRGFDLQEASRYIPQNIVTRSVGPLSDVEVDMEGPLEFFHDDTFLLCSDGLSAPVSDREVGALLRCLPADEAAHAMIDMAILRGGPDNITVIVIKIFGLGKNSPNPNDSGATTADFTFDIRAVGPASRSGPYAGCDCDPSDQLVEFLSEKGRQLGKAAQERSWAIDWQEYDSLLRQASAAAGERHNAEAIRGYCRGIRSVFSRLRNRRNP